MNGTKLSTTVESCETCSDAGLLVCSCEFYADWPRVDKCRPWMGRNATLFAFGHRTGRSDACRRLWSHLDPEGRQLATLIATEGTDA